MFSFKVAAALLAFVSLTCFTTGERAQSTWYVDDDNCPGPGSGTHGDPFCMIQDGIDAAVNADEVVVDPGTYNELIGFLGKAITLRSSGGADVTTIDGTGLDGSVVKCVSGEGADTVLDGFTITGGAGTVCHYNPTSSCGAGMFNDNSSPTVTNCTFSGNMASYHGGGMYNNNSSSPTVTNCTFSGNTASGGG
ncbi:MAG: right-handed parallel beta-helix repeat-containing protein, partial [Planctomycetota bacterium]